MIIGLWHPGSGVGDQIFCYLAAKITSERLGVPFCMVGEFKGKSFIQLPVWESLAVAHRVESPAGKIVVQNDWPIYEGKSYYDPEFNFIEDNTVVDGCRVQDERYFENYPISQWLQSEPEFIPATTCVINFRGGEFSQIPELFLSQRYWDTAIEKMKALGYTDFQVHTDDPVTAKQFFPEDEIIHDVGRNWRSVRSANAAIIANSAFGIIPRLLRHKDLGMEDFMGIVGASEVMHRKNSIVTIAPRRWSRPYENDWDFAPQNYYKEFLYV